jgi:PIN domain nuclease of toxin-antitoxin system
MAPRITLLDTMAFIFWHADSPRLGRATRRLLERALQGDVRVSVVSAFEIATKARLGKLQVPQALIDDFAYIVAADGFTVVELSAHAAASAGSLAGDHRDPFDRLLAAQALELGAQIASADAIFATTFGIDLVW